MSAIVRPSPAEIRLAREENPKMRERDLAQQLGISEAELVAAYVGARVARIRPDVDALLEGIEAVGEVMALTRNESAVHEKIGVYENTHPGRRSAMVLGPQIDLRIFPSQWVHGFMVEKGEGDDVRRSLQYFDAKGDAVHKVHLRPSSDLDAFGRLADSLLADDQTAGIAVEAPEATQNDNVSELTGADAGDELRQKWTSMTDVHQFSGILRSLKLTRQQALSAIGDDFAWQLDSDAVSALMHNAANEEIPIMVFVGNKGCIQIHSGPISAIKPMGPWLNVMDPTFHLHLRLDHIREVWAVRKPNVNGHVTSVEVYGANGELIIQFFGKRMEGSKERPDWRMLAEGLPRLPRSSAA